MPERESITQYMLRKLTEGGWRGVEIDEDSGNLICAGGVLLEKVPGNNLKLNFYYYGGTPPQYTQREKYSSIIFPDNFDIRNHLYIRNTGNYKLSNERQFKKIVNNLDTDCEIIKISGTSTSFKRFYGTKLVISKDVFVSAMSKASSVAEKQRSFASSVENYLAKQAAQEFGNDVRRNTTYAIKGEASFFVDRLNLATKRSKRDFERFLNTDDIESIEVLAEQLIRHGVFTDDFLRRLNDYFIRERLSDIIKKGRAILNLGSTDLTTARAIAVQESLGFNGLRQLETLWQKYFEKYLLYLIFSYKKIFPKVELKNIEGDKKCPDFIGVNHYNGLDIIEIKTHLKNALVWDSSHENFYFSPEMSKAIVQTTNYMDAIVQERFKKPNDRRKITEHIDEENLYHPRGIIIISSKSKLSTRSDRQEALLRDFTKLRNSVSNIQILTFDEVIDIADEYISNIVDESLDEQL